MVEILSLLGAAVVAVLVFTRLGLGSVLGYLAAGLVIGPSGFALVDDPDNMRHIGEIGVVFLLFLIGIEIKPQRLWVMRRLVFGLGGSQVMLTGVVLAAVAGYFLSVPLSTALVIGFGLALSSTAFGIQILADRNQMTSHWGRSGFATLLFQDLAVVPLMVLVPLLVAGTMDVSESMAFAILESAAIFITVLMIGKVALNPLLHAIARLRSSDAFVATALLLVLGFAYVMEQIGLSMAMGAFIAGVLLADSEYRHQVEADVQPFRGLFLGLFFMSVGMALDPASVRDNWQLVLGGTVAVLAIKTILIIGLARAWRMPLSASIRVGFLLCQSGEFGFVLFALADDGGLFPDGLMAPLLSIIVMTMAVTPLMVWAGDRLGARFSVAPVIDTDLPEVVAERPVLIAGFGRVGETVAGMLFAAGVPCVCIDADADSVARGRRRGFTVFFGDASRPDVLRAVGAAHARLMVITLDDPKAAERLVQTVRRLYPEVPVHVRARDWDVADRLSAMGAAHAIPETVEASLRLGAAALDAAGIPKEDRRALFEDLKAENFAKMRAAVRPNKPSE